MQYTIQEIKNILKTILDANNTCKETMCKEHKVDCLECQATQIVGLVRAKILKAKLGDEELKKQGLSVYPFDEAVPVNNLDEVLERLEKSIRDTQLSAILKEFEEK